MVRVILKLVVCGDCFFGCTDIVICKTVRIDNLRALESVYVFSPLGSEQNCTS